MNEELESKANDLLVSLIEKIDSGGEVLTSEIPGLLEELLRWKMVESLAGFLLAVCLLAMGIFSLVKIIIISGKSGATESEPLKFQVECSVVAFVVSLLGLIISMKKGVAGLDWLQIWLAPKVYLIEYAAELVR